MLKKDILRKAMLAERKSRFTNDVKSYRFTSAAVAQNAIELIKDLGARNVMLYMPLPGEADITAVTAMPLNFYIPVTFGAEMRPAVFEPGAPLVRGEFGVLVPAEPVYADKRVIDLVLAPGVAFDRSKNRLGHGKGCYDLFLSGMDCVRAGVAFDWQLTEGFETGPHDIKMDHIITESGYF